MRHEIHRICGTVADRILCGIMAVLEFTGFKRVRTSSKILKITIPENLDYQTAFDDVMKKHTLSYTLTKIKTTELGSLYELIYEITVNSDIKEKEFIDEMRCVNGNLSISLLLSVPITETEAIL